VGVLQRFERRLEGLVNGAFARAFRSEVQPVEIAAGLQRELDDTAKALTRERSIVPNDFTVALSPGDHQRLAPYEQALRGELTELVQQHADAQHYAFSGPVRVQLAVQDGLGTGSFRVHSTVRAGVEPASQPSDSGIRRAVAVLEVNGVEHPVIAPGLVLGRSTEADLRIDDPGVSRRHAEIRVVGDGTDAGVEVLDLGSTNGLIVDGRRVERAQLGDGSRLTLGSTVVTVRRVAGRGAAGGPGV
jgi:Protein of unknown function (DUF3662)/FHA domain